MSTFSNLEPAPADVIRELPGDRQDDVLFNANYGLRTIELHRPEKYHSLDGSMIRKIVPRLQEWAKSDMANVIVIKGSGSKAFCAGGDVASIAKLDLESPRGLKDAMDYFSLEYRLDHLIATYSKPYVAFMDGVTMGGGVGLSMHAPIRIATENTLFAMPETTIGFFPDVGASFFLSRMPGALGTYLALTSERLKGVNAYYAGVATHYMHSATLPMIEQRLAELRFKDYDDLHTRLQLIDSTIDEFSTGLPNDLPNPLSGKVRKAINRCFGESNIQLIMVKLMAEKDETKEWAEKTIETLQKRSPTSLCVALRQLRLGKNWSIAQTFFREHQLAAKFMRHPDFKEGVSALLIRKDGTPQWQPKSLEDVGDGGAIADPFFEIDESQGIELLNKDDYTEYPHRKYGLPSEQEIYEFLEGNRKMKKASVVEHFVQQRHGKQGVKESVEEVLNRRKML